MENLFSKQFSTSQHRGLERLEKMLVSGSLELQYQICPCGADFSFLTHFAQFDRYGLPINYAACKHCGLIRMHPNLTPHAWKIFYKELYMHIQKPSATNTCDYDRYFSVELELAKHILSSKPALDVYELNPSSVTLLDFGCGYGGMVALAENMGMSAYGCDYDEQAVAFAKSKGLNVSCGDIDVVCDRKYDIIILSHVVEHVFSPRELLVNLSKLLNKDGVLYIETPGYRQVGSNRYDYSMRRYLRFFHPYSFDLYSLTLMCSTTNLQLVEGDEWIKAWYRQADSAMLLTNRPIFGPSKLKKLYYISRPVHLVAKMLKSTFKHVAQLCHANDKPF
jgi:SAM-dependent methyltransferase